MKYTFALALVAAASLVTNSQLLALGRGGGGFSRGGGGISRGGGGMARPAVHAPSMSRPNFSRPNVPMNRPAISRPNIPTTRPNIPNTRPNVPNVRPNFPTTRPNVPNTRPNVPSTRPSVPNTRPPTTRPNLPGSGGINRPGTRPNLPTVPRPGGGRPSTGDVRDFLDLPGRDPGFSRPAAPSLPNTRPNLPNTRPNIDRPNVNRPNVGNNLGNNINRPNIEGGDTIRNRFQGGHNINVGNVNVDIRNNNINNIKNRWNNSSNRPFDRNWWVDPGFGRAPGWRWQGSWGRYPRYWCYRPCTWVTYGTWFAWSWPQPVSYNYGSTVVYRDNYVYVNDTQSGTAAEYYEQADTLAESVPESVAPEQAEWLPLGVFAVTDPEGNDTSMLIQLAVSKEGIIAGTFYNSTSEKSRPLEGMVDRDTQRAAWQFADDKESTFVMEAGIYDLTQDQTSALLHFDADNSQNWLLVRLPEPDENQ